MNLQSKKSIFILFFLLFGIFIFPQDDRTKSPDIVMKELIGLFKAYNREIDDVKLTPEQEKQNKEIADKIENIFHYKKMIYGALNDQLSTMTQKQVNEFFYKFKELIGLVAFPQGSYFYNNSRNKFYDVIYKDGKAYISSDNHNYDKDIQITMTYIYEKIDKNWMLIDLEMNEHSLVEAYKLQINRIVKKDGIKALLETLDKKYKELKKK
ncbi:MAG: ABC transporter substrate-binding protein [Spirochaetes bacterium]|nr:ABC transporter substrate-binding protein [Spirochaetota bacterium]